MQENVGKTREGVEKCERPSNVFVQTFAQQYLFKEIEDAFYILHLYFD